MAKELDMDSHAEFMGRIKPEDVRKHFIKGCVLVLPTMAGEGMPNLMLEAISVGLPLISTDIAGIPDIVKHGKSGLIVKTR